MCELTGSNLIVATLDRMSRNVLLLETIKRRCEVGGFGFMCADMPEADSFMLGIMAQVAQYEREKIGERTRLALQAAKRRGVKLGNPNRTRNFEGKRTLGARRAGAVHRTKADSWAAKRRGVVAELVAEGLGCSEIAMALAARRITTPRGSLQWTATGVKRLLDRLSRLDTTATA